MTYTTNRRRNGVKCTCRFTPQGVKRTSDCSRPRLTLRLRSSTAVLRLQLRFTNQFLGIGLRDPCGSNRSVNVTARGLHVRKQSFAAFIERVASHYWRIMVPIEFLRPTTVFAGQIVGIREVDNQIWLVSFMDYDLGFFDKDEGRIEPGPNPFAPDKVLTTCPV